MKILILSDVHANEHALRAVLDAAPEHDQTLCLGDIVGYGEQLGLMLRADVAGRSAPRHEANSEQRTANIAFCSRPERGDDFFCATPFFDQ